MANVQVEFGFQTNMQEVDFAKLFEGTPTTATKQRFVLESGEISIDFRGTDLRYDSTGMLKAGIIDGWAISRDGQVGLTFDGLDLPMKAILRAISTLSNVDDQRVLARGLTGNDRIFGADKRDFLVAGDGKDIVDGSGSSDIISGGGGADRFFYHSVSDSSTMAPDFIIDFSRREHDRINLVDLGELEFVGTAEYSGAGPEVRTFFRSGNTVVAIDLDNDRVDDMQIDLSREMILQTTDFVLA